MGFAANAVAEDSLQQKVDTLEQEVASLKAQMSQRNAELMAELVSREQTTQAADSGLTAGYDKNFFIKSSDDEFRLNIGGRLQFRHTYSQVSHGGYQNEDGDNVSTDGSRFELERGRVIFSGHAMKNLKYQVQLDVDSDGSNAVRLYNAYAAYSFMPEFGIKAGFDDLAYGKQRICSSGKFMGMERMMVTNVFDLGRSTGVEGFGTLDMGDAKLGYRAGLFNGLKDDNDTTTAGSDNNPIFVGRIELPLMGATAKDFSNESDLAFHENPVMMIGAGYVYANERSENNNYSGEDDNFAVLAPTIDGGYTSISRAQGEFNMFSADVSYKCNGFSATVEGFYQSSSLTDATLAQLDSNGDPLSDTVDGDEFENLGWYAQAGQFIIPEKFELFARMGGVDIDNAGEMYEYSGGWNYYINGQDLKLTMDITYIDELVSRSSSANYDMGVLGESLFLVRSQLQFQF